MDARVMVVEDVSALRRFAVQALDLGGYVATGVGSLAEALFVAAVSAPDVLVVDERVIRAAPDRFLALIQTRVSPLGGVPEPRFSRPGARRPAFA